MTTHKLTVANVQPGDVIEIAIGDDTVHHDPPSKSGPPLFWRERLPLHLNSLPAAERALLSGIHLRLALDGFSATAAKVYLDQLAAQNLKAVVSIKTESSNGNTFASPVVALPDGSQVPDYPNPHLISAYVQAHEQLAALKHPALFAVQLEYGTDGEAIVGKRQDRLYAFPSAWGANESAAIQAYYDARYAVMITICQALAPLPVYSQMAMCYHAWYRAGEFYDLSIKNHGYKNCAGADYDPPDAGLYVPGSGFGIVGLAKYMRDCGLPYAVEPKGLPSANGNIAQAFTNMLRYSPDYLVLQSDPDHEGDPAYSWLAQWLRQKDKEP